MALEAIATLGLACNVMQVIRYGSEAIDLLNQIYKLGGSIQIADLDIHAAHVNSAAVALQASMEDLEGKQRDRNATDLHLISQKCLIEARNLQQCIDLIPRGGRKRDIFGIAMWILKKRSHADKIRQRLDMFQRDLDTRILVNLSLKINSQPLQTSNSVQFREQLDELVSGLSVKQREALEKVIRLEGDFTREAIARDAKNTLERLDSSLSELHSQTSSSRYHYKSERLLSSLEYPSMNARRNQIPLPQNNTFDWLFHSRSLANNGIVEGRTSPWDPFDTWLEIDQGIYWINGKAGSGKSTLMKHIVDSQYTMEALRKWAGQSRIILLSHYFWTAGNEYERSSKGAFLSLLHQILLQSPEILQRLLLSKGDLALKKTHDDWSEIELIKMIEEVRTIADAKFCFFIDGLDESEQPSPKRPNTLLDFLHSEAKNAETKCCVSSRPLPRYERAFAQYPQMRLQDLTDDDIKKVIDDSFRTFVSDAGTAIDISALQNMREAILQKADGVFLWVSLVLKSLKRGFDNGDDLTTLQRRLASLPSEIEKLYEHMWNQLNEDEELYREEAAFIFTLVLHREDFWMVNTEEHNSYCRSLCFFAMVINGVDIGSALPEFREAAVERIEAQSIAMIQMIRTRCAGILEVVGPDQTKEPSLANGNLFHDRLKRFITQEVRFIHRSAYAFLVETSFGRSLLSYCPHSRIDIATRIVQCALLFWHTKVTNQGELPYTLHLAERFMVQHARTKEERQGLSDAISATLEMYKRLSGWSTGEQDGSYLLYQYIDPAVRYHTVDTAGWMLSFATKQIFEETYNRPNVRLNPAFTNYLLLCLASQIHFRVKNPRHQEQVEHLQFLLNHDPRLDTIFFLRYPYPFKKSAALILTENLIYDLLQVDHLSEPYELMNLFFIEAARLEWDLSTKFIVLWIMEGMYESMVVPIERIFVTRARYSTTAVLEVNLCYLLELIIMGCGDEEIRATLKKVVSALIDRSPNTSPEMKILLVSVGGGRAPDGFRNEAQRLDDIDKRGWKSLSDQDATYLEVGYEQYQVSRPEVRPRGSFGQQVWSEAVKDGRSFPDAVEDCARRGTPHHFFDYLEARGYCKKSDDICVMHKAPKPFLEKDESI